MKYENTEYESIMFMDDQFTKIQNLNDFLRWAFDDYSPYWLRNNMIEELTEACEKCNINEDVLEEYLTADVWRKLSTEDGVIAASEWFSEIIGNNDESYLFHKYGHRRSWDNIVNALTEIIMKYSDTNNEDEANDHANSGTFHMTNTFDAFPVNKEEAKELLLTWLPDYWD